MADTDTLKIVSISDLHFGNPKINAGELYEKLRKYFYPKAHEAHLITINGDIFDQLLVINSKAYKFAALFIRDLFRMSAQTGCQIRILHGTYSHDRDQLSIFNVFKIPRTRVKIINEIYAEEITDFTNGDTTPNERLRVGYLPDNLVYQDANDAVAHLKRAMTTCGFTKLDLLIGHGTFAHALPVGSELHMPPCTYNLSMFDKIVEGKILMGHIHTPSIKNNCFYIGSFERMAHNEEETKGFLTLYKNKNEWKYVFRSNPEAIKFITVKPEGDDISAITTSFIDLCKKNFPQGKGYVRALVPNSETRAILHRVCTAQFPNLYFSAKSIDQNKNQESLQLTEITLDLFDNVKPTPDNLGELIYQFLEDHNDTADIKKEELYATVKRLINNTTK